MWRAGLAAAASLIVLSGIAGAAIAPGSAKQVASLVAAAAKITTLPTALTPSLSRASGDNALRTTPSIAPCIAGSTTMPPCVFGDTNGTRTMVLFGDSHALMWFPAINAIAKAARWRLVALMGFGCPVADVTIWNIVTNGPDPQCARFRTAMIARIDKLNPALVVMSEGFFTLDASHAAITDAQWTAALERSLAALHSPSMKKVLIGNTILVPNPIACLAASPGAIQTCSKPEANATYTAQRAAEKTAAKAESVPYIDEIPWTCSSVCTVVIGRMVAYNSAGHLSATYAAYLAGVLRAALRPSM